MKRILRRRPSPATVIALTALVVALGGVAYATIPDSSGTIHGCFSKQNGNLRVIESSSECRTNEEALNWSQDSRDRNAARAYARVLPSGTLDEARSNNVEGVAQPSAFIFCLNLDFTPVNIVATPEAGAFEPSNRHIAASVDPGLVTSRCPEGFRSALVDVLDASGFKGFYVVIR